MDAPVGPLETGLARLSSCSGSAELRGKGEDMQVDFYQLGGAPVETVLLRIAQRVTGEGGRLLVVTADEALADRLDTDLWQEPADGFLPHGRAGGPDDARQPILISADAVAANQARAIALVDGLWRDEALAFDRAFHFFDDATVAAARTAWKALADRDGVTRNFWKQEEGKWAKVG